MRIHLRIVSGTLRGRKLTCTVNGAVRPTPDMVRQALFSMLGDAVPDRPFVDIFAGSGAVGIEAISRGARETVFVERDVRLASDIDRHLEAFQIKEQGQVLRADAYRWAERWEAPAEPVNLFISPPFIDFERRLGPLLQLLADLQLKAAPGSVLVLQTESRFSVSKLPAPEEWEERCYGRNQLLIWAKAIKIAD